METEDEASMAAVPPDVWRAALLDANNLPPAAPVGITNLPAVWPVDFVEARPPTSRAPSLSAEAQLNLELLLAQGGARLVQDDPDWRSPFGFLRFPRRGCPPPTARTC